MIADWDGHPDGTAWTGIVTEGVGEAGLLELVPGDVDLFCHEYAAAPTSSRTQFWLMLVSAIAKMESNFDPKCVYKEPPPLSRNSIGLMQLSLTDRQYGCDFPNEEAIKDPRRNLLCAVRIIDRLVSKAGRIGGDATHRKLGAAAYWSTLRLAAPGKRDARGYVISRTQSLDL